MPTFTTASPTTQRRWYVVQCKPRQDCRALEHLARQGFRCYLPTLHVEKLQHGLVIEVEEPLFPGYLFIELDELRDNWQPIRSTRGVNQIVRFNEYPVPVRDEIIEAIRRRLADSRIKVPYLRPGERVVVTEGCFADLEAIFVANDGQQRVTLLATLLHREQMLSFPVASIRKARAG
jgi:transcriptional antiterminator RfaH